MANRYAPTLDWIRRGQESMRQRVIDWASINSGSENLAGLALMADAVERCLRDLGAATRQIELGPATTVDSTGRLVSRPLGHAVGATKHRDAPLRVFLCIHFDTVYGSDSHFQHVTSIEGARLRGPGVADAKGGLVVLLTALEALERSPWAGRIGWEVLLNPDEEIGSPGSAPLLAAAAESNDLGLLFEPALPDGNLVGARKGSANAVAVVRGRSAHAGRDFHAGRNAVVAMAELVVAISAITGAAPGLTVNVGKVEGGGPANVVPDFALCRFNIRADEESGQRLAEQRIADAVKQIGRREGFVAEWHVLTRCPPKKLDKGALELLAQIADCGRELGLDLSWRSVGGVSDGNRLASAGLPTIDTLGVRGGAIHSAEEFLWTQSLSERACLCALLLMKLASGEMQPPGKQPHPVC